MPLVGLAPAMAWATNLLVVVLDDVGADKVGGFADYAEATYGGRFLPSTPTLDELAAGGLSFTHAWATPYCSPTRASLLTGLYPHHHGVGAAVNEGEPGLEADTLTLAEVLRDENGYATGLFGKWHLGDEGSDGGVTWSSTTSCTTGADVVAELPNPRLHGFDTFVGSLHGELEDFDAWVRITANETGGAELCLDTDGAPDELHFAEASTWIAAQTGPWFALLTPVTPHPDGDGRRMSWTYDDLSEACKARLGLDGTCVASDRCGDSDGDFIDDAQDEMFAAGLQCTDALLGELLDGLDDATLSDTLVVVVGDNGTPGNGGTGYSVVEDPYARSVSPATGADLHGKGTSFLSGIRVPLLVADGSNLVERRHGEAMETNLVINPGRSVSRPVLVADLLPTFVEAMDIASSATPDGGSFAQCLTSAASTCASTQLAARAMYTEWFNDDRSLGATGGNASYRRGNYRFMAEWLTTSSCMVPSFFALTDSFDESDLYETLTPTTQRAYKREVASLGPGWMPLDSAGRVRWCR